jgi:hypothetical protein
MTKIFAGTVALMMMGAAVLPLAASAAEQKPGLSNVESTDISARRRHYRHRHYARHYVGPRRYWGPRYGYDYPYPYSYRPYYYQPAPFVPFGFGPYGLRVF